VEKTAADDKAKVKETMQKAMITTHWMKQILFHHLVKLLVNFVVLFFCPWSKHKLLQK